MPDFTSLADLLNYIEKTAVRAVQERDSETQRTMIETGEKHVQTDVYDIYSPTTYQRTGQLKKDWEIDNTIDGISMKNIRTDEETGNDIAYTVETGKGYKYPFPFSDTPRPFVANTAEELKNSGILKQSVKSDLKKLGLSVE
ncbi:hypothetical protein COE51_16370 [Bacillus pseudomycoides]|nr:hypothetical protein COE51_16370 [Bacillus pseudomycoides]